jgi:hypothetical protein
MSDDQKDAITVAGLNKDFKDKMAQAKAMRICENCDAWNRTAVPQKDPNTGTESLLVKDEGECRSRSPVVCASTGLSNTANGVWPVTHKNGWCREFRMLDELRIIGRVRARDNQ